MLKLVSKRILITSCFRSMQEKLLLLGKLATLASSEIIARENQFLEYPAMQRYRSNTSRYWSESLSEAGPSISRSKHPPHLKGKEIGLFYAKRNKERKSVMLGLTPKPEREGTEEIDLKIFPVFALNINMKYKLRKFLSLLRCTEEYSESCGFQGVQHIGTAETESMLLQNSEQKQHQVQNVCCCLSRVSYLDKKLYQRFCFRNQHSSLQKFRKKLPSYEKQDEILSAINDNQIVLVMGETGCGKTTQVPQFILDSFIKSGKGSLCKIVCTQPRRISAITVAERVAEERSTACGEGEVGFQIRLQALLPADQGSILFCTTGILLQWLHNDPHLVNTTHIIVDEVHERDLLSDFSLVILRDLLKIRKDLKLIMMSATLNFEHISQYFGGCPMIAIHGVAFPVEVNMLEDIIEETKYTPTNTVLKKPLWVKIMERKRSQANLEDDLGEKVQYLESLQKNYSPKTVEIISKWNDMEINLELIVCLIKNIMNKQKDGAILIFLPGWEQISKLNSMLSKDRYFRFRSIIVPLHSLMPTVNQKTAFQRPPHGKRKIILATNIAETSITINDVVFVIDSGKMKLKNFDPEHNLTTLQAEWISKANAKQRKGRAGRTQKGVCFRLFTQYQEQKLVDYQLPEMLRTRLEGIILKIKLLKLGYTEDFLKKAMDPPASSTINVSLKMLKKLEALDQQENLTPLGYHLARLPLDPQTGKMCILGVIFSCLDPILSVAASFGFREAFVIPLGEEWKVDDIKIRLSKGTNSDHLMMHFVLQGWENARNMDDETRYCDSNYLSKSTLRMLGDMKLQIAGYLRELKFICSNDPKDPRYNKNSHNIELIKAVICSGLYPNVAKLVHNNKGRKSKTKAIGSDGTLVVLHPKSINSKGTMCSDKELLVYYLKVKSTHTYVHDSTFINYISLILFGETCNHDIINGIYVLIIDNWLTVECLFSTILLIKELRKAFHYFLRKIFQTPEFCGSIAWKKFSQVIIKILSNNLNSIVN